MLGGVNEIIEVQVTERFPIESAVQKLDDLNLILAGLAETEPRLLGGLHDEEAVLEVDVLNRETIHHLYSAIQTDVFQVELKECVKARRIKLQGVDPFNGDGF